MLGSNEHKNVQLPHQESMTMKRLILASVIAVLGFGAIAPVASAQTAVNQRQLSTPSQLGEGATLIDLVQHNRDARNKK